MKSSKKTKTVLLTREEAKDFLKISFPTLRKLTVEGLLKSYTLGGRVYYKEHELIEALQPEN